MTRRNAIGGSAARLRRGGGPRRRAVDRAAVRSYWNDVGKLALRRNIAGDVCIVGLWKCGIMRLWDCGIGSRCFQFQNSIMVYSHNCTISQLQSDVEIAPVDVDYCSHLLSIKKEGSQTLRPKTLFRVGRTLRLDLNLLRGSVGIVPNYFSGCNGAERKSARS